MEGPEDLLT